jgi:hypothetical protein
MEGVWRFITQNIAFVGPLLGVLLLLLFMLAFRAFREGREISIWPPRIGPRPNLVPNPVTSWSSGTPRLHRAAGSESESVERIEPIETGFKAIFPAFPLDHVVSCFETARTRVLIFANWFPNAIQIEHSVVAAARNGAEVQIMLLNPESAHAKDRSHDLGYREPDTVSQEIIGSLKELARFVENEGVADRVHVRLHDFTPTHILFGWQDAILLGVYLVTVHALQGPFIEFAVRNSLMGQALLDDFEKKWASAQPYSLQSDSRPPNSPKAKM